MRRPNRPGRSLSQEISEFICRTAYREIPAPVRDQAKLHLLDGLATMLAGTGEASARLLLRHGLEQHGKPEASIVGGRERLPASLAALVNGVQAHVHDYDDAQTATLRSRPLGQQVHPTSPVLAAALALAEKHKLSGQALIVAYTIGVEVACRLGDAIDPGHYLKGFHPTGTLGVFGAAAACAYLLKLSPVQVRHALGVAGTFSAGLRANRGTMAKGLNAGRAAESGVLAVELAARGFTASENIFDDAQGFFAAACHSRVDRDLLRFGSPFFFATPGVAIKLYPCAGVLHPAVDLAIALRAGYGLGAKAIDQVRVALDPRAAAPLVYDRPKDALQSKFSLRFAVAASLLDGAAGLTQFTTQRLAAKDCQNLMRRIELVRRPAKRFSTGGIDTEVEIRLKNGATIRSRASIARGHPKRPATRTDIEAKFRQCAAEALCAKATDGFLREFWNIDQAPSVAAWLRPLCPR